MEEEERDLKDVVTRAWSKEARQQDLQDHSGSDRYPPQQDRCRQRIYLMWDQKKQEKDNILNQKTYVQEIRRMSHILNVT